MLDFVILQTEKVKLTTLRVPVETYEVVVADGFCDMTAVEIALMSLEDVVNVSIWRSTHNCYFMTVNIHPLSEIRDWELVLANTLMENNNSSKG